MTRRVTFFAVVLAVFLLAVAAVAADKVTEAMGKAQTAYGQGDYKEAGTQLQTALVGVNQKLIDLLIDAMPAPPPGWKAEDPEGLDPSAFGVGFFAALMVDRTYYAPSGSAIEFTIAANSPMLATLRMFVTNPMLASMSGQSGMEKTTVCGYDTIEQFGEDTAEINVLAGNATLIGFSGGSPDDRDDMLTLANATDCKKIVSIVE